MRDDIKLVSFDMSGTLVLGSGSNSGAKLVGRGDFYDKNKSLYQDGSITMQEFLTGTFAEWEGLSISKLPEIIESFTFRENAEETVKAVKKKGYKTAFLTNVPIQLSMLLKEMFEFDFVAGTNLEVIDNKFTGKILEYAGDKVASLGKILNTAGLDYKDVVHIGDRRDDAEVFEKVSFGIAISDDDYVNSVADYQIEKIEEVLEIL
ncbi:MAG: haloacid dehalogenase-like hydrolase [Candidatus Dojkabacteria bacterium]|nr:haloacid dehalogenase-like hydrolase [Candidatus Dojkabacteria bacterium]MDQ7020317.1 haloacid dehalogenase-like hydrolase [Candidatus Dojkabacteria bacterium]